MFYDIRYTTVVDLKDVFRESFKVGADAIIIVQNHPSCNYASSKVGLQINTNCLVSSFLTTSSLVRMIERIGVDMHR